MYVLRISKKLSWLPILGLFILGGTAYRIVAAGGGATSAQTANNLRQPIANTNGLVAWYPLDGDVKDYSGDNFDGSLTNFTYDGTTNGWVNGKFSKGLQFDGLSDKVMITKTGALSVGASSFSVSAWVRFPVYPLTNGYNSIVQSWATNDTGWGLITTGSALTFRVYDTTKAGLSLAIVTLGTNATMWHHVVATMDRSTNTLTGYFDGVSVNSGSTPIGMGTLDTSSNVILGARDSAGYGNVIIDDVRIYNRVLPSTEVAQLYAGSASQNCDQYCKVWLKFDDNTGMTASDSSGNGNVGTINGTATWITGNFASALTLNGSTGYISVPNLSLTSGTIDMWINPTTLSGDQHLFTQLTGATTQAGQLDINQSSGESGSLWVWDGTAWQRLSANGSLTVGQWNHIVVTNSGYTVTAYINGTQQLIATAGFAFAGGAAGIGAKFLGTTGGTFNGKVDEFRIYSRILAPEEIADQWRQAT